MRHDIRMEHQTADMEVSHLLISCVDDLRYQDPSEWLQQLGHLAFTFHDELPFIVVGHGSNKVFNRDWLEGFEVLLQGGCPLFFFWLFCMLLLCFLLE